jgi:hypothetical protein
MRKVLTPVLMLVACALILAVYNFGLINGTSPAPTPPLEPTANPNPTAPLPSPPTDHLAIPATGEQAPDFTLPSVWGDMVTLSRYEGQKNAVLVFYRTGS